MAEVINESFGRKVLPIGELRKKEMAEEFSQPILARELQAAD
jgi:hypothetical protein